MCCRNGAKILCARVQALSKRPSRAQEVVSDSDGGSDDDQRDDDFERTSGGGRVTSRRQPQGVEHDQVARSAHEVARIVDGASGEERPGVSPEVDSGVPQADRVSEGDFFVRVKPDRNRIESSESHQ